DIHLENYVFRATESRGYWSPPNLGVVGALSHARFESVLSITILPTVYSLLLDVEGEIIFKIIYPLIFSLVPLVLYRIYEVQMRRSVALFSVFFFMSSPYAFFGAEPLSLGRQMVGEFFLVLSIFLLVDKSMSEQKQRVLFLVFGAALVVSHYALSYFYVFLVVLTFLLLRKWRSRKLLSAVSVLLLLTMTFLWYLYISDAPLIKLTEDFRRIYYNFIEDLLNPAARAPQLSTLSSPPPSIVSLIHRIVFYVQNLLIIIGVIQLIAKRTKTEIDSKYRLMSIISMGILVSCLAIPYLATSFQLTRFYAITIIFLSPFFVLGGESVFNWITKTLHVSLPRKTNVLQLVSIVLIICFLFSVGFVDHIAGTYPESLSLDKEGRKTSDDLGIRMSYYDTIIPEQDVFSATWLSKHMNTSSIVYADTVSRDGVLNSYGLIPLYESYSIFAYSVEMRDSYVYLRYVNVVEEVVITPKVSNLSLISSALDFSNKIYASGASEIYSSPG
ncbi:MAG: DUF2206 domain-containing protein, partial [Candidatus Bathyarchaeota archaeon]